MPLSLLNHISTPSGPVSNYQSSNSGPSGPVRELELIQTQMTQKPMLRAEVGMRVRCANKASAE